MASMYAIAENIACQEWSGFPARAANELPSDESSLGSIALAAMIADEVPNFPLVASVWIRIAGLAICVRRLSE